MLVAQSKSASAGFGCRNPSAEIYGSWPALTRGAKSPIMISRGMPTDVEQPILASLRRTMIQTFDTSSLSPSHGKALADKHGKRHILKPSSVRTQGSPALPLLPHLCRLTLHKYPGLDLNIVPLYQVRIPVRSQRLENNRLHGGGYPAFRVILPSTYLSLQRPL